jgi:hypothetical protein
MISAVSYPIECIKSVMGKCHNSKPILISYIHHSIRRRDSDSHRAVKEGVKARDLAYEAALRVEDLDTIMESVCDVDCTICRHTQSKWKQSSTRGGGQLLLTAYIQNTRTDTSDTSDSHDLSPATIHFPSSSQTRVLSLSLSPFLAPLPLVTCSNCHTSWA